MNTLLTAHAALIPFMWSSGLWQLSMKSEKISGMMLTVNISRSKKIIHVAKAVLKKMLLGLLLLKQQKLRQMR